MLRSLSVWYHEFRADTTIHGLSYTLSRVKAEALLWYAAVGLGFYLVGLYGSNIIQDWQDRPVSQSFGDLAKPVTEIQVKRMNIKGSNPEESFKHEVRTYVKHVLTWSRLSPNVKGSNPEESFISEVRTYVKHDLTWSRLSLHDRRRSMSIICSCYMSLERTLNL